MKKIKLCVVVTDPMNLWSLYRKQFVYLQEKGFEVTAIASSGVEHEKLNEMGVETIIIEMERAPSPIKDLLALFKFIWFFLFNRFDIVSVSTPKASLLASIAGFFTLHKVVFTVRGRAYENKQGFSKRLYEWLDKLICCLSVSVFCISHEILDDFVDKKLCNKNKIFVIGDGSSNGVDLRIFTHSKLLEQKAKAEKSKIGIEKDDLIILSSGRIRKDKGIEELVSAFVSLSSEYDNISLLIQGEFDRVDHINDEVLSTINTHPKIYRAPWSYEVEVYFAMADIFAFPSYREGFGNVALEASALCVPVVAFDVVGCRESVQHNKTGLLSKARDVQGLKENLELLIVDDKLRTELGINGRKRIERSFDSFYIWDKLIEKYKELLL